MQRNGNSQSPLTVDSGDDRTNTPFYPYTPYPMLPAGSINIHHWKISTAFGCALFFTYQSE